MLLLKNILFAIVVPGTIAGWLPVYLGGGLGRAGHATGSLLAVVPLAAGWGIIGWCIMDFMQRGRGTPAPMDPPITLVIAGLYRYARNPMYLGVLTANLGWTWLLGSRDVAVYAAAVWLVQFAFVVLYEEPKLRQLFGSEYEQYCRTVRRWGVF